MLLQNKGNVCETAGEGFTEAKVFPVLLVITFFPKKKKVFYYYHYFSKCDADMRVSCIVKLGCGCAGAED